MSLIVQYILELHIALNNAFFLEFHIPQNDGSDLNQNSDLYMLYMYGIHVEKHFITKSFNFYLIFSVTYLGKNN